MDLNKIADFVGNAGVLCLMGIGVFIGGHRMGYIAGQSDGDCHCAAGCDCEAAPEDGVSDDINRLSDWFQRLDERLQRIERRRDIGDEQPPAGQMQGDEFKEARHVPRGYPEGALRHTPSWLKPTRKLLLDSMVHHNAYYIDRAHDATTDEDYRYAMARCLYWSRELTAGKDL